MPLLPLPLTLLSMEMPGAHVCHLHSVILTFFRWVSRHGSAPLAICSPCPAAEMEPKAEKAEFE